MIGLEDAETAQRRIAEYIKNGRWWVIPSCTKRGNDLMYAIERTFYWDEASVDFDVMLCPSPTEGLGMLGLAFAHKRRMSREQLSDLIQSSVGAESDILLAPDTPAAAVQWLHDITKKYGATN